VHKHSEKDLPQLSLIDTSLPKKQTEKEEKNILVWRVKEMVANELENEQGILFNDLSNINALFRHEGINHHSMVKLLMK
jgi:hypothetical protein